MASSPPLLAHFRRLVLAQESAALSDGQLLDCFLTHHEEAAFAALVRRHGPMVLTVCRRVVGDLHDSEDAFQATFLVLARKAASIARRELLANWLYGVAYRTAREARRRIGRRRNRERQVMNMPEPACRDKDAGSDVLPLLDEELNRLPENYRSAIVLCDLQGRSRQQAARELGCAEGTLSSRLARGRELLRKRLTRRGLAVTMTGLTTALSEAVGQTSPPVELVHSAAQAAKLLVAGKVLTSGVVSAHVAALSEAAMKTMLLAKLKIAVASILVVGSMSAGIVALNFAAPPDNKEQTKDASANPKKSKATAETDKQTSEAEPKISVAGKVVDSKGHPVKGATVYLRERFHGWLMGEEPSESWDLAQSATNDKGEFAFQGIPAPPLLPWASWPQPDLVALAPGHAAAWKHLHVARMEEPVTLRLESEAAVQGRLLDLQGAPVRDALVRVITISQLDRPARPDQGENLYPNAESAGYLDLKHAKLPLRAKTDADGRFTIAGLPREVRVTLEVSDDRFLPETIYVATTNTPQSPVRYSEEIYTPKRQFIRRQAEVHTTPFVVKLGPGFRLDVEVVAEDTGKPLAFAQYPKGYYVHPELTADAKGRYTLRYARPERRTIYVYGPKHGEYVGRWHALDIPPNQAQTSLRVPLPRGVPVVGRVVDEQSGQGVLGVRVFYIRNLDQANLSTINVEPETTPADGSFRMVVPPGKGDVVTIGPVAGYLIHTQEANTSITNQVEPRYVRTVNAEVGKPITDMEFKLTRGVVARGRVLDPEGKPVAGAVINATIGHKSPKRHQGFQNTRSDADGKFELAGLSPDTEYTLLFTQAERRLGTREYLVTPDKVQSLPEGEAKLQPMAEAVGHVVDDEGKPVKGVRMQAQSRTEGDMEGEVVLTDAEGKFRVRRLMPGQTYQVDARIDGYTQNLSHSFEAGPARVHDAGKIRVLRRDQVIEGRVVDSRNQPVSGVRIYVGFGGIGDSLLSEHQRTRTDENGRFSLVELPRGDYPLLVDPRQSSQPNEHLLQPIRVPTGKKDVEIRLAPSPKPPPPPDA